jgi:hypothetical protein
MFKTALSGAAAAIVLTSIPARATIISTPAQTPASLGESFYAGSGAGLFSGTGITTSSVLNSSSLTTFELRIDPSGTGALLGNGQASGRIIAPLAAMSSFTIDEMCPSGRVDCVGRDNRDVAGEAIDALASMPPGAGGDTVKPAITSDAYRISSGADKLIPSHAVPEPVSLAILALGLLGISAGIRKYFS